MSDLLNDELFLKLEKEFKLLSRFRDQHSIEKQNYVIVDIETTGLEPDKSEIIEIGAIKTDGLKAKDVFTTLIYPTKPVPNLITNLTGISQEMVEGKPSIREALLDFTEFIGDNILVAHNTDFDISFLKYHISKHLQKEMQNKYFCTLKLARQLVTGVANYKLGTIANHMNITIPSQHRAMGDVEVTYNLWNNLVEMLRQKNISTIEELNKLMI